MTNENEKPLREQDLKIKECVRCGFCCKQRLCQWGELTNNEEATEDTNLCRFLATDNKELGTYKCLKWEYIEMIDTHCIHTMCGTGCSSTLFNTDREKVLEKIAQMAVDKIEHPVHRYVCKNDSISCDVCKTMHGQIVSKELVDSVHPPHHTHCRCTVERVVL
jgi:SPP1 gp7 family putative phage head morphogenesis protein